MVFPILWRNDLPREHIRKRLEGLWDAEMKSGDDPLCPMLPASPPVSPDHRPKLLIVGMNPSLGKKEVAPAERCAAVH